MEELFAIDNFYKLYESHPGVIFTVIMVSLFFPMIMVVKKFVSRIEKFIMDKGENDYSKIFSKHKLLSHSIWVFIALYLMFWGGVFEKTELMMGNEQIKSVKNVILRIYIVTTITSLLITVTKIIVDVYKKKSTNKKVAIDLHMHIVKIFIMICATLSVISIVLGVPVSSLFASIGAAAALLTFVFKDTVVGLVASLQLTFQDIIRTGDWVTLPQYNADGDIEKITVTVVLIRNFDKTYTTVPTAAFLNTGVRNWRGMFELGGRRIKRAINVDLDTVKICDQKTLDKFKKMPYLDKFAAENKDVFDEKNGTTNLLIFRNYIHYYLRSNQEIHQDGFTFLVRELSPTTQGIPVEMYMFTKDTSWVNYEMTQANILDHILGIMPQFGLRNYQLP